MFAFPPFETRERRLLIRRVRHDNQRHLRPRRFGPRFTRCHFGAGGRHTRRFALHLAKVGRPGRIAEPFRFIPGRELEQLFE